MDKRTKTIVSGVLTLVLFLQGAVVWLLLDQRAQIKALAADMPEGESGQPPWAEGLISDASRAASEATSAHSIAAQGAEDSARAARASKTVCDKLDGIFC